MAEGQGEDPRAALIDPMREIYGVSDKVLAMTLANLLLAAPRPFAARWSAVGARMIAIDTLVHNFLHRTGILHRFGGYHPYGPDCYQSGGCAEIIEQVADSIDARQFNPAFRAASRGSFSSRSGATARETA